MQGRRGHLKDLSQEESSRLCDILVNSQKFMRELKVSAFFFVVVVFWSYYSFFVQSNKSLQTKKCTPFRMILPQAKRMKDLMDAFSASARWQC